MKKTERSKPSAGRTSRASYRRHPMSLVQRIAVTASAVITFAILVALLAYILIMGVPNLKPSLFAWHYTSDNCSMTPAIINTDRKSTRLNSSHRSLSRMPSSA